MDGQALVDWNSRRLFYTLEFEFEFEGFHSPWES